MKAAGGDGKSLELFPGNGPRQGTGHGRRQRHRGAPVTVDGAFEDYEADLRARGSATLQRAMAVCTPYAWILPKPVPLLTSKELKHWRDGLLGTIKPSTINRLCNASCAAFELA